MCVMRVHVMCVGICDCDECDLCVMRVTCVSVRMYVIVMSVGV